MASTSRQARLFGVQDWTKLYEAYSSADLQSYDYESLRKNFIDYLTRNYPETFNDYIESSEFVALLDVIAYMGQALAFRGDLNARENFLDTAERRDSVVKLANLVGYTPKRNKAAEGVIKVTSVKTTENITDSNGYNLSNTPILWNDPGNANWQDQFNTIINAALLTSQRIGKPGNSQTISDVKTDEYTINIPATRLPIVTFQTTINGASTSFELVSATSLNSTKLYEVPPSPKGQFNVLYRNDKLGYGSANTGFFFYFKQGSLQQLDFSFAEKIQNNIQDINVQGINDNDVWLWSLSSANTTDTLWTEVPSVYATASVNGSKTRTIYSITSRANDQITFVFGDGVFSDIPVGSYRTLVRSSNALQYTINPAEMNGISATIDYISRSGKTETLTVTLSLQTPNSTALTRESLANIKERAPARYYTQNRMVNGEDYTNFPYTLYNSIIKSKAVNRTSIGVARNLDLLDPTGKYSSTNVFAADGALTFDNQPYQTTFSASNVFYASEFVNTTLANLLSQTAALQYYHTYYQAVDTSLTDYKWHLTAIDGSKVNGFFFTQQTVSSTGTQYEEVPQSTGSFSSSETKYLTKGALVKFVPVDSTKFFDESNRITSRDTGKKYIWVAVENVVGDGYNYGIGNLSEGVGPITLSGYVPRNTKIAKIIPQFSTNVDQSVRTEAIQNIRLQKDFVLQFDHRKLVTDVRWSLKEVPAYTATPVYADYLVKFTYNASDNAYVVSIRNVDYYFSSVSEVRFLFNNANKVFDPKTGKVLTDTVTIKEATRDVPLYVVGQPIQSDGFSDDFRVSVSAINQTSLYNEDPDVFVELVKTRTNTTITNPTITSATSVFSSVVTQTNGTTITEVLPPATVVYESAYIKTLAQANDNVYEYATGSVFFAEDALTVTLSATHEVGSTAYNVTATSLIAHLLSEGLTVEISGAGTSATTAAYNGKFTIVSIVDAYTFTYATTSVEQLDSVSGAKVNNRFYQSAELPATYPAVLYLTDVTSNYKVEPGLGGLHFQYRHNSGQTTRIDPATTNIIDLYLVTQAYYTNYSNWVTDTTGSITKPDEPTLTELQLAYNGLNEYKMLSDSVVLNSVTFKPLFGSKADPALQATIKVVKGSSTTASDTQIRSSVLAAMNKYFDIANWNFGDTFYFSELSAYLHSELGGLISSTILVPADPSKKFGDMYEIKSAPYEIFVNAATTNDIVVITSLNASNMNR